MTQQNSPVSGVAERYAAALFDLALESKALEGTEVHLNMLSAMLGESEDLRWMVRSPVISAEDQSTAMAALAAKAGITGLVANFIGLLCRNRRLFALTDILRAIAQMLADHRGEVSAHVVSAQPLSDPQTEALKATLRDSLGKDVALSSDVDSTILGGLVVKVGSRMIDSSLRTKLNSLKTRLKEAN